MSWLYVQIGQTQEFQDLVVYLCDYMLENHNQRHFNYSEETLRSAAWTWSRLEGLQSRSLLLRRKEEVNLA